MEWVAAQFFPLYGESLIFLQTDSCLRLDGDHRRSFDTVYPLAQDLGLFVDTSCKRNRAHCLAKRIKRYDGTGNILISWRHGKMSKIAEELGTEDPPEYPEERLVYPYPPVIPCHGMSTVLMISKRYDLVWTIPYPYTNVTEIWSEECPGLDYDVGSAPLRVQV